MEDLCLVATCLLTSGRPITDPTLPDPFLTVPDESLSQPTSTELHLLPSNASPTTQSVDVELEPELNEQAFSPRLSKAHVIDFSDSNTANLESLAPVGQVTDAFEAMPEFSGQNSPSQSKHLLLDAPQATDRMAPPLSHIDTLYSDLNESSNSSPPSTSAPSATNASPEVGLEPVEFSKPELARGRFTSVAELSDVQSSDWAFQSLQSLIKRYKCIDGYPDVTFWENQPLSRHEFAADLNACLEQLGEYSSANAIPLATQTDLATIQRLQQDFAAELATLHDLHDQIDRLADRTAALEANQFSTTTNLSGKAIFALVDAFSEDSDLNPTFGQKVTLNFNTSFTGHDHLTTSLRAADITRLDRVTGFNETRLGFDTNTDNEVEGSVSYRFPLGENVEVGTGVNASTFTDVVNPFFASGSSGAISRFGRRNPIYRVTTNTDIGMGAIFDLSDAVTLNFGYAIEVAEDPSDDKGLFNGNYGVLGQLTLRPSDQLELGLTYIHSYSVEGRGLKTGTGSKAASLKQLGPLELERPVVGNSFGIEASYHFSDHFAIGGWVGYTAAQVRGLGNADVWNWAITLAFPDLGRHGNLGGILVGMQPRLSGTSSGLREIGQFPDPDVGWHIEAFYRHEVTHHLSITPGFILLTAPDHNTSNAPALIGTIRTVFKF